MKPDVRCNKGLRENGYVGPGNCSSLMYDVDWSKTKAYGLGINGLYLNLRAKAAVNGYSPPSTAAAPRFYSTHNT